VGLCFLWEISSYLLTYFLILIVFLIGLKYRLRCSLRTPALSFRYEATNRFGCLRNHYFKNNSSFDFNSELATLDSAYYSFSVQPAVKCKTLYLHLVLITHTQFKTALVILGLCGVMWLVQNAAVEPVWLVGEVNIGIMRDKLSCM